MACKGSESEREARAMGEASVLWFLLFDTFPRCGGKVVWLRENELRENAQIVATGCFLQPGFVWDDVWFGTDGSGGVHSKDPRLRKCAWAVVAIKQHLAAVFDVVGGVCGLLVDSVGPNTVGQGWVNCVC